MKKLIALLLLTFSVQAFEARRTGVDTYAFRFIENGVVHCWGMYDYADLNFFSPTWMKVTDTATAYNWPRGDINLANACNESLPKVYRTTFTTLYDLNNYGQIAAVGTVPLGTVCGDRMSSISFLRSVTFNGRFGFAICA